MRRPSSPLASSAVLASVAASGMRRSSSSTYGVAGIGSGGGAGGSAAGLVAATASVGAGGGSILGNVRSGGGAIPAATPQALQVCSPHGMHAVPCMLPCMHAPGPAGAPAACYACHALRRACMHAPLPACMHGPHRLPRGPVVLQGGFNSRISVGGSSPMQQLRRDSEAGAREDFEGCMRQLESECV